VHEALTVLVRLLVAIVVAVAISMTLQGCTASGQAVAKCVLVRSAARCLPTCLSCVRQVAQECQGTTAVPVEAPR
jgi:hypothetical protein